MRLLNILPCRVVNIICLAHCLNLQQRGMSSGSPLTLEMLCVAGLRHGILEGSLDAERFWPDFYLLPL